MSNKLPWVSSAIACALLALISSQNANDYKASIDTQKYHQSGNLQIAWIKPEGMGNGLAVLAILWAAWSVKQLLSSPVLSPRPTNPLPSQEIPEMVDEFEDRAEGADIVEDEFEPPAEPTDSIKVNLYDRCWHHRKRHLLIPAETGGGKTTFLLGLIKNFWVRSQQSCEVYGSTAKESPWLGLEADQSADSKPRIINVLVTNPASIEPLIERLRWVLKRLTLRQAQRAKAETSGQPYNPTRILVILDEWNITLAIAKRYDQFLTRQIAEARAEKASVSGLKAPYAQQELIALVESILLLGREDEVAVFLFGQDHQVQNAAINTGYQKSFGILVPFRQGAMQAVEQALTGRSPVTPSGIGKATLIKAYAAIEAQPEATFVYSNLNGHEIIEVPHLPGIKRERVFNGPATTSESVAAATTATAA